MSARIALAVLVATVFVTASGCDRGETTDATTKGPVEQANHERGATTIYTVAKYDPSADPAADLAATVTSAQTDGKRIILEIGGQW